MASGRLKGRQHPRFSGIKTFFRLPLTDLSADYEVALFGLPYDGAVSYRPGARFAPSRIRETSSLGRGYHWSLGLNWSKQLKVADIGDCAIVPLNQESTYKLVEEFIGELLQNNKKFIGVGGDHSLTLPVLRAMKKKIWSYSAFAF